MFDVAELPMSEPDLRAQNEQDEAEARMIGRMMLGLIEQQILREGSGAETGYIPSVQVAR